MIRYHDMNNIFPSLGNIDVSVAHIHRIQAKMVTV